MPIPIVGIAVLKSEWDRAAACIAGVLEQAEVNAVSMASGRRSRANGVAGRRPRRVVGCYRRLPTIPNPPDGRDRPTRAETAAVVAPVIKSGIAEIVSRAIIPVAGGIAWCAADGSSRTIDGNVVVGRLLIAGQEAIVPAIAVPLVSGRGECNGWQQRQENCCGEYARHWRNINGLLLKCDVNRTYALIR